ncbi:MAG: hypothetical protein LBQ66_01370 [Planctomycetaceae bacterium]|nr:hypothetical protein [Planctomycetaceae bacterium]
MSRKIFFVSVFLFVSSFVMAEEMRIDAPVLFVKRHNYLGLHIYDTYYKWRPGGGIYVLENPSDPPEKYRIRAVIDASTPQTLGDGVYSDPDLSWDAKRILFCYKASQKSGTCIYEIGVDGKGLRQVTDSATNICNEYHGSHSQGDKSNSHDVTPAYLPDGRIVFTSTRYSGLVPCANEGVNILHVMNADGSDIHPISVNNVNEFDPSVMPDGRILFGRWEYIDKNALTQQSTWSVFPDGTNETALFANNLVFPEATLQLRSVPGAPHLVCSTFTKHNAPPRGSIAMIDMRKGKDEIAAITNFENTKNPTYDLGESCDPWPLSENLVLYSGQLKKGQKNSLMFINRKGERKELLSDSAIDLHNPIPIVPRAVPPVLSNITDRTKTEGFFFVQNVYAGIPEKLPQGSIKWLRVIEETSRISPSPGPTVLNQTFLVSAALAFSSKNYLGIVPVEDDGSAFFVVPSGKAVYFQLLDKDYKLVRSMRTFIQAAPGVTRSCVGCHEYTPSTNTIRSKTGEVRRMQPESWGSGPVDYPTMVQPILNKHCVKCHGGDDGVASGLDLTGGWTEYFNNSYENLVSRREVIFTSPLIGGIDCMNGTAHWSAQIFGAYAHGSGKAPLADVLISGHKERITSMTKAERELILAWIDSNGLYHGTWNYTKNGYTIPRWQKLKSDLIGVMNEAGCVSCHADNNGNVARFEADWINLERPEWSRILRAPLPKTTNTDNNTTDNKAAQKDAQQTDQHNGFGLGFCRADKVDQKFQRLRMVTNASYQHAVREVNWFPRQAWRNWDKSGEAVVSFRSTDDRYYQKMLRLINAARYEILSNPRIDMPRAVSVAGQFRQIVPTPLPRKPIKFTAEVKPDSAVQLQWERSAETYGLNFNIYRNDKLIAQTTSFQWTDLDAEIGQNQYKLVLANGSKKSQPIVTEINVAQNTQQVKINDLRAESLFGLIKLYWNVDMDNLSVPVSFDVERSESVVGKLSAGVGEAVGGAGDDVVWVKLTGKPIFGISFDDFSVESGKVYNYRIRPVSRRGEFGEYSKSVREVGKSEPRGVVFDAVLGDDLVAKLLDGGTVTGKLQGEAKLAANALTIPRNGQLVFQNRDDYNCRKSITVDFWVKVDEQSLMPVFVSFGKWNESGWFVQWLNGKIRWHVSGNDCDGGEIVLGQWTHLVCQYDGETMRIIQDGKVTAERPANTNKIRQWKGELVIGNYSADKKESYQLKGSIRNIKIMNYQTK